MSNSDSGVRPSKCVVPKGYPRGFFILKGRGKADCAWRNSPMWDWSALVLTPKWKDTNFHSGVRVVIEASEKARSNYPERWIPLSLHVELYDGNKHGRHAGPT